MRRSARSSAVSASSCSIAQRSSASQTGTSGSSGATGAGGGHRVRLGAVAAGERRRRGGRDGSRADQRQPVCVTPPVREPVDCVLRHAPVGRQLAADEDERAGLRIPHDRVAPREVGGAPAGAGEQRPQAGVAPDDVLGLAAGRPARRSRARAGSASSAGEGRGIVGGGPSAGTSVRPIATSPSGCGTALIQRPRSPGTGQLTPARGCPSRSAADQQVRAAAGPQLARRARDRRSRRRRPRRRAGARTANAAPVSASTASTAAGPDVDDLGAGEDAGAVRGGGARDGDHQPGVVLELAVPVAAPRRAPAAGRGPGGAPRGR